MTSKTAPNPSRGPRARGKAKRQAQQPRLAAFFALTLSGMIGGLIVLAGQTVVPQITRAPGIVVPLGNYTKIESVHGGIVQAVHVVDGQPVEEGTLLLELTSPDLRREAFSLQEERASLDHQIDNARAILAALDLGRPVALSDITALREAGLDQAAARLDVFAESQRIKTASITQQMATNEIVADALAFAQERVVKKRASLDRLRDLKERGLIKLNELQSAEEQADGLQASASDAAVRLAQETKALMLARAELLDERLALREEIVQTLTQLEPERSRVAASERIVAEKLDNLRVTAPANGIVQSVAFPSAGELVEPGETIFELLPSSNTLIVEARIPNIEIGHIAQDQEVAVTFDSFDARRFGQAQGVLALMSPVPLIDEATGEQYFRASVELKGDTVGTGAFQRPITAGLTVVTEMVTGEQTLLSYVLKPVQHTLNRAFTER